MQLKVTIKVQKGIIMVITPHLKLCPQFFVEIFSSETNI